ncbi:MAG: NFACT family protein [Firmicutes bacterium]|nr:NFACT family protein [Bacillota bacterium]
MPFDGAAIASVVHEFSQTILGGRVDKISQPEPDEIFINMRGSRKNYKLLMTTNAGAPRVNFTSQSKTAPLKAPMFCMVLRKHLTSGRIVDIVQPEFERIVEFHIEALDEMGDKSVKILTIEIMGKHSNIMLLDANRKILDAIKHVSPSVSAVRPILPGMAYSRPPSPDKQNPMGITSRESFIQAISAGNLKLQPAIYQRLNGISPILSTEICTRAQVPHDTFTKDLTGEEQARLYGVFSDTIKQVTNGEFSYNIYWNGEGKAVDISTLPMVTYDGYEAEAFDSPSAMLEAFYARRDEAYRISQKTVDLRKLITTHQERCRKKSFVYERTLEEIKDRDTLRIKGELLTAYLYAVGKGADTFTAQNFYDDNKPMEITLDPTLTPAENAQRYFKQYNKQKRTYAALQDQIEKNLEDLTYLDSVAIAMETITDEADIAEIRAELATQGFAKRRTESKNKKAAQAAKPLHYISSDGFDIYVGKNNTQNDNLTLRMANNHDIWMHTKDIPGSHVIVITGGKELPGTTILEAANLAAFHSKARNSTQVPVDYVAKRHVRKPNGAKPGFVIYDSHKTVYVTPVETALEGK